MNPDPAALAEAYLSDHVGLRLKLEGGQITVATVPPGTPADVAGLRQGDVLIGWRDPRDSTTYVRFEDTEFIAGLISAGVRGLAPHIVVETMRGGTLRPVAICLEGLPEIDSRPGRNDPVRHAYSRDGWEATVRQVAIARCLLGVNTDDRPGANEFTKGRPAVTEVLPDSLAAAAGLAPGDVLVRWEDLTTRPAQPRVSRSDFVDGWADVGMHVEDLLRSLSQGVGPFGRPQGARNRPVRSGLQLTYVRDGKTEHAHIPLEAALPLRIVPEPARDQLPLELGSADVDAADESAKLAVAAYVLAEEKLDEEGGHGPATGLAHALLDEAQARADDPGMGPGDRLVYSRLAYLLGAKLDKQWEPSLATYVVESAAMHGREEVVALLAEDLLARTQPPDYLVRVETALDAVIADRDALPDRIAQHLQEASNITDVLQAATYAARNHDLLSEANEWLHHVDTNSERRHQLEWLATYSAIQTLATHESVGPLLPSNHRIDYKDDAKDTAQPLGARVAGHIVEYAASLFDAADGQALEPLTWGACAYVASRSPLTDGGIIEAVRFAHTYLKRFPHGAHAAEALATRAAFLGSSLPDAERQELRRLALAEQDAARRDALVYRLYWTIPPEQEGERETLRGLVSSAWAADQLAGNT